jgi:hypothetical protein
MFPDAFTLRSILSIILVGLLLCVGWRLGDWLLTWPATPFSGVAALLLVLLIVLLVFGL